MSKTAKALVAMTRQQHASMIVRLQQSNAAIAFLANEYGVPSFAILGFLVKNSPRCQAIERQIKKRKRRGK